MTRKDAIAYQIDVLKRIAKNEEITAYSWRGDFTFIACSTVAYIIPNEFMYVELTEFGASRKPIASFMKAFDDADNVQISDEIKQVGRMRFWKFYNDDRSVYYNEKLIRPIVQKGDVFQIGQGKMPMLFVIRDGEPIAAIMPYLHKE